MELGGKHIVRVEFTGFRNYPQIHVHMSDGQIHLMDPMAISSWGELLGYDHPDEALEAIILNAVHKLEPEPDYTRDGENVWTDSYMLLEHRERARENEYKKAQEEGRRDDPRSPRLRSSLAAHNAVHQPIDGGECAMDRCRRGARDRMGLPEPSRKGGADTRLRPRVASTAITEDEDRRKLREVVSQCEEILHSSAAQFLHQVSGNVEDPMKATEPEPPLPTREEQAEELIRKYQEPSDGT